MIKNYLPIACILISVILLSQISACTFASNEQENAEANKSFEPGIGFFMGRMQIFHEKLGISINEENVDLANFYIHELEDNIEEIEKFHAERKETQLLHSLIAPIEGIEDAIAAKDFSAAKEGYLQLTNTCNACHQAVDFEFIVVKVPTENRFVTQDFRKK